MALKTSCDVAEISASVSILKLTVSPSIAVGYTMILTLSCYFCLFWYLILHLHYIRNWANLVTHWVNITELSCANPACFHKHSLAQGKTSLTRSINERELLIGLYYNITVWLHHSQATKSKLCSATNKNNKSAISKC